MTTNHNASMQQINANLDQLWEFYTSNATLEYKFRRDQLIKLKTGLQKYEAELIKALHIDLNKPEFESYASEIGMLYDELNYALSNLKHWLKPRKVRTPLKLFHAASYVYQVPLGVVLIIAPWNYPIQLLLSPLIGALAAGNCVVLKPSELMACTNTILHNLINEIFAANYVTVIQGDGAVVVPQLIQQYQFNHVFFTGSAHVGRVIADLCAAKLIPYTLELGGKSPVIIDQTANLDVACKRIAWAKLFNAGQTCVAPDYVIVHTTIKEVFIERLKYYLTQLLQTTTYAAILNDKRMTTLIALLQNATVIYGGEYNVTTRQFMPTLIDEPILKHPVMQTEIFGPILPILSYSNLADIKHIIAHNPNPLALYIFSQDNTLNEAIIQQIPFGGGCVNTALMHLVNVSLPFGGVMESGQGKYHGKYSFDTFSHSKAILKMSTWFDAFIKYQPYTKLKLALLRLL